MTRSLPGPLLALAVATLATARGGDGGPVARPLPRGERLVVERGCCACHAPPAGAEERLAPAAAPRLDAVATRVGPGYLAAFLADPAGVHPGTRMPDVLASLPAERRAAVAEALVHFLMGLGTPAERRPVAVDLATLERGRRLFHERGCVACHRPQAEPWELEWSLAELAADDGDDDAAATDGDDLEELEEDEPPYVPPGTLPHPDRVLDPARLARKTTVDALEAFLLDPLAVRPAGLMPDPDLAPGEARALAHWLLRDQTGLGRGEQEELPGLAFEYFEAPFEERPPDFDALAPAATGRTDVVGIERRARDDRFGFRFRGLVDVPRDGEWTFHLSSDDGSWLAVDGVALVDNGGVHPPQWRSGSRRLTAGRHALELTMYEFQGGEALELEWEGPGLARGPLPAERLHHVTLVHRPGDLDAPGGSAEDSAGEGAPSARDAALARAGREHFAELGCAGCHSTGIAELDALQDAPAVPAPPLTELADAPPAGCLESRGGAARVRVPLEPADRAALRSTLADPDALAAPLEPAAALARTLDRLGCLACHRRAGLGGVHPVARPYFVANEDAEVGDEGRFPPHLTLVGAKLRAAALEEALGAEVRRRPYLAVRMPRYPADERRALAALLPAVDRPAPDPPPDAWDPALVQAGHKLVGRGELGCIQCHAFAGYESLGVQAVDLVDTVERLHHGWFTELMLDPKRVDMQSRMPSFWPDGESPSALLDGDPARQTEAVWAYLSQGAAMALPAGLVAPEAAYELVPTDEPITAGVFMQGVSPRTLVVGFPELGHYAFDVQHSRLAKLWRGRFFNARGTWDGRAGRLELPASPDALDLPPGPALARLADPAGPWPDGGLTACGRRLDAERRPTLRYALGAVAVEETPRPVVGERGVHVARDFRLRAAERVTDLWLRPFAGSGGARLERDADGWLRLDAEPSMRLRLTGLGPPLVVRGGDGVELRVPVPLERVSLEGGPDGWGADFTVEVDW